MHSDTLDEVVDGMLGSGLGKKLTQAEREQMKTMLKEQAEQASVATVQAEQTEEGRMAARIEYKKKQVSCVDGVCSDGHGWPRLGWPLGWPRNASDRL
jgi:ribonuclease HII